MTTEENSWRTPAFRQSVVQKIDEAIRSSGMPTSKNSMEMEKHVFQKAKTREEYLGFVARLILHVREMNSKKAGMNVPGGSAGQNIQDPINALQTLARQGTGNNSQQFLQQGLVPPNQPPQPPQQVTATNLLQTLNQRPMLPQKVGPGGVPMGPMTGQMGGPMGQINNPMGGGPIGTGPMGVGVGVTMAGGPMGVNQMGVSGPLGGGPMGVGGPQMSGGPMGGMGVGGPLGGPMGPSQMGGPMGSPVSGQMGGGGPMAGQMGGGPMSGQMGGGPMAGQMGHMGPQRKPNEGGGMMMGGAGQAGPGSGYVGVGVGVGVGVPPRSVAPNTFLRQSPTPPQHSAQSPASAANTISTNQMVSSPALVPSPNAQITPTMGGSMRSIGMAPSPSGSSLNTPGQAVPTPSPCSSLQDDQAYREKARQLSKYIEPLRRMIAKMGNDDVEKLSKMSKLLDILSNPSKRMPLETLLKCEVVLEKLDFKRGETGPAAPTAIREQHPLLEAVNSHLQSPLINHTLQRTFGPCLDALFGSDINMLPPLVKKRKLEEPPDDIPEVLQGEIARLDQRFKVSLDPTQQSGSRSVQLLCWLDDRHLPCVPPVSLTVPEDYPCSPPRCHLSPHEYSATRFLTAVQSALESRIRKLPGRFSVSQLLDTWEMSVRQACAPTQSPPPTAATVLMGL